MGRKDHPVQEKKKKEKKIEAGGECVDHDRYEKWVAG